MSRPTSRRTPTFARILTLLAIAAVAIGIRPAAAQFVPAAVAAGGQHACLLTTDGGVKCWGNNLNGQLGNNVANGNDIELDPVDVFGLASGVTAIAAGEAHTCALTLAGAVKCWGRNFNGQVGDGIPGLFQNRLAPVDVVGLSGGVAAIAAGANHSCALGSGGGVKCWGMNFRGQAGSNGGGDQAAPVDVIGLSSGVTAIAAGGEHTCALTADGAVKCWGWNLYGQVGDGGTTNRFTPVAVSGLVGGVASIAAGQHHACAVTAGGAVKCWGRNFAGQLGDGSSLNRLTPVDASGLAGGVVALEAGDSHTCALTTGGGVKCWGGNGSGQLGNGAGFNGNPTPSDVIGLGTGMAAIAAGGNQTCALAGDGALKCWGGDFTGNVPASVPGQAIRIAAISTGAGHNCALTTAGGIKCWGSNGSGQLGDGSSTQRLAPVDVAGMTRGVAAVAVGESHTCALTAAGGVKCWGSNFAGGLGDGQGYNEQHTAQDVAGLGGGVRALVAGQGHTCALTVGGGVKCWGFNNAGQLGDGTTANRFTAMDVPGLTSGVAAIVAGTQYTCALTTAGGVKCWGSNYAGSIGDNSSADRPTPVDVFGLSSGVAAISGSASHTCALASGGAASCWGFNGAGQLGDLSTVTRRVPVGVLALPGGVAAITAGGNHSCALTAAGAVACWGGNYAGAIGNGAFGLDPLGPTYVSGFASGAAAVGAGGLHSCAVTTRGGVKCWGYNLHGELGDGTTANKYTPVDVAGMKSSQSIVFAPPPVASSPFSLTASAGSGLAVAFDTWTPATCTVSGGIVTPIAAGLCGVRASQPGDSGNSPAPQQSRLIAVSVQANPAFPGFNADAAPDLLWRNSISGNTYVWYMNGAALVSDAFLVSIDPSWSVEGVADFNGDGHADIVWRNNASGASYVWYMNGTALVSDAFLFSLPTEWVIQGVADFNADGKPDFLMRNTVSGNAFAWFFDGGAPVGDQFLFNIDPSWKVEAVADFNGDGQSDLLFRNTVSGLAFEWDTRFSGGVLSLTTSSPPIFSIDPAWEVAQVADWNADGKPDLVFRNKDTGVVFVWYLDGTTLAGSAFITQIDPSWEVVPRR